MAERNNLASTMRHGHEPGANATRRKVIYCHECRAAGRSDRDLHFTNHAMTSQQRKGWTPCP